jgi:hypothetical protein
MTVSLATRIAAARKAARTRANRRAILGIVPVCCRCRGKLDGAHIGYCRACHAAYMRGYRKNSRETFTDPAASVPPNANERMRPTGATGGAVSILAAGFSPSSSAGDGAPQKDGLRSCCGSASAEIVIPVQSHRPAPKFKSTTAAVLPTQHDDNTAAGRADGRGTAARGGN